MAGGEQGREALHGRWRARKRSRSASPPPPRPALPPSAPSTLSPARICPRRESVPGGEFVSCASPSPTASSSPERAGSSTRRRGSLAPAPAASGERGRSRCLKLWLKWASFCLLEKFEKKKQKLAAIGEDLLTIAADQPFVFEIVLLKALILGLKFLQRLLSFGVTSNKHSIGRRKLLVSCDTTDAENLAPQVTAVEAAEVAARWASRRSWVEEGGAAAAAS